MLPIINRVLSELNEKNIRYIHFKSNEHLHESFSGDTDFDILVDIKDHCVLVDILEKNGFRLFRSVGNLAYNNVFDYLFLDSSGKMIHFHLHTAFITGTKFIKEYHLPIEKMLLESWSYDDTNSIKVINPSMEACLLWIRYFSKNSCTRFLLKRGKIGKDYLAEDKWLISRTDYGVSQRLLQWIFPDDTKYQEDFIEYLKGKKSFADTFKMLIKTKKVLRNYKTANLIEIRYLSRRFRMMCRYALQKYSHLPFPYRRVEISGGKIIAVVGCDGAGKSTVNSAVVNSIKKKADVFFEYLGSGDGHCYWYRYPLLFVHRLLSKNSADDYQVNKTENEPEKKKKISTTKIIWAILLAKEKESKLRKVNSAKTHGMIVLCDRYPQTQFKGINDGPLLSDWINSSNSIRSRIGRWETEIYGRARIIRPDLVIKLMITESVSRERKPQEKPERIHEKIRIMEQLEIPAEKTAVIDATQSIEKVLENVYTSISKCISST